MKRTQQNELRLWYDVLLSKIMNETSFSGTGFFFIGITWF